MIYIGSINKEIIDDKYIRISSEIDIDGDKKVLFFESDKENEKFICDEKADGFLVGLLILAMKLNSDIRIEDPISERLLYGLKTFLIPALVKMNPDFKNINIYVEKLSTKDFNKYDGVATGISGGVDSFYTVLKNMDSGIVDSHKMSHLVLFNAGNFGLDYQESTIEFYKQIEYVLPLAKSLNLPFVYLNSNLMEFVKFSWEQVTTFSNIASGLILQNLIKTYYYSSTYSIDEFRLDFSDNSYYDLINQMVLKMEGFEMISFGGLQSRFEKTKYISSFNIVNNNLNVCLNPEKARNEGDKLNCSKCTKCIQTMTSLDIINKLDLYDKVFDLSIYEENKAKYWGDLRYYKWRTRNELPIEIIENAKINKYKIPRSSFLWMIHRGIINQVNKLKR